MKTKTKIVLWYVGLASVLGAIAFLTFRAGHPIAALLVVVIPLAMIVNGFVAEWEDTQPGGFNNPDPKAPVNREND